MVSCQNSTAFRGEPSACEVSCRTLSIAATEWAREVGVPTIPVKRSRAALSRSNEGFLAVSVKRPLQAIRLRGALKVLCKNTSESASDMSILLGRSTSEVAMDKACVVGVEV